jgi:hypothetical protein
VERQLHKLPIDSAQNIFLFFLVERLTVNTRLNGNSSENNHNDHKIIHFIVLILKMFGVTL